MQTKPEQEAGLGTRDQSLPEWDRWQHQDDFAWLAENLSLLAPAAKLQYQERGRGAVIVDASFQPHPAVGHPVWYLDAENLAPLDEPNIKRMVQSYFPETELVVVLLKPGGKQSGYCVAVSTKRPH